MKNYFYLNFLIISALFLSAPCFALNHCSSALESLSQITDSEKSDNDILLENFAKAIIFETPLLDIKSYVSTKVEPALTGRLKASYPDRKFSQLVKIYETELSPARQNGVAVDIWNLIVREWVSIYTNLDTLSISQVRSFQEYAKTIKVEDIHEVLSLKKVVDKIESDPKLKLAMINIIRSSLPTAVKKSGLIGRMMGTEKSRKAMFEAVKNINLMQDYGNEEKRQVPAPIEIKIEQPALKVEYDLTAFSSTIQEILNKPEFATDEGLFALLTSEQYPILFSRGYFDAFLSTLDDVMPKDFVADYGHYSSSTLEKQAWRLWQNLNKEFWTSYLNYPKLKFESEAEAYSRFDLSPRIFIQSGLMVKAISENPQLKVRVLKIIQDRLKISGELAINYYGALRSPTQIGNRAMLGVTLPVAATLIPMLGSIVVAGTGHPHLADTLLNGSIATMASGVIFGPATYLFEKFRNKRLLPKFDKKVKAMRDQLSKGEEPKSSDESE